MGAIRDHVDRAVELGTGWENTSSYGEAESLENLMGAIYHGLVGNIMVTAKANRLKEDELDLKERELDLLERRIALQERAAGVTLVETVKVTPAA